ncbi:MAG: hypothetical protein IJ716_14395 [Lachnospiraceae bacterium]|nr:hypothetical protein [Lachnospiraceae bacterium]
MRKFKYDDGTDGIAYETIEELLNAGVTFAAEYNGAYYIQLKAEGYFDHGMYKVDKQTKKVSYFDMIDFMVDIKDKAVPVDLEKLRNVS